MVSFVLDLCKNKDSSRADPGYSERGFRIFKQNLGCSGTAVPKAMRITQVYMYS